MRNTNRPAPLTRMATGLLASALVVGLASTAFAAPNLGNGKTLYTKFCLACHFPDGRPKMRGSPDLSKKAVVDKITDQKMTEVILNGTPHMPGYKKQMGAAGAADVVAYVRSLAK